MAKTTLFANFPMK